MNVLVFANGRVPPGTWLERYLEKKPRTILAADGGAKHLLERGLRADLVIGDLDSFPEDVRPIWEGAGTRFIVHSSDKDETDLELALLHAVGHFESDILVFGSQGGRLDQALANILLLAHPKLLERRVILVEPGQMAWLLRSGEQIKGRRGDTVSLVPVGGSVLVHETSGLSWALRDEVLDFGPARGISNVMTGSRAAVRFAEGHLLCIHTIRNDMTSS